MTLYPVKSQSAACWPEPLETTWQLLGGERVPHLAPKLPHLGLADILFLTAVMNIPRQRRPWGIVNWMADVFALSRPALYALTERVTHRLQATPNLPALPTAANTPSAIELTPNRLARTALTASLPGKMALRPLRRVLQEAFGQTPAVGWINALCLEAGHRAGHILRQVNTTPLGTVIVARDETFFQGHPLLLVIDPVTTTILLAEVASDRQAETWGAALLLAQNQGVTIGGLVEDMARMYAKSQEAAQLDCEVQKDIWHIQHDGRQVRRDVERAAFAATRQVMGLEKQLLKQWDEALFDEKYVPAVAREEQLYAQHDTFAQWFEHLVDALELVDWRSGEIRERPTNAWLLEETLAAMALIDQPQVQTWVKTLRRHQTQLLTSLDWFNASLQPWRRQLAESMEAAASETFIRTVARCWRLRQALINGHRRFRAQAHQAHKELQRLIAGIPWHQQLADQLSHLLDAACRTSSLIENVNGLLKQFLHNHRAFHSPETLQLYLNLFVLWHNTRVFERGKRQGKSPYQRAGIDPGHPDWLTLLGYPPQ